VVPFEALGTLLGNAAVVIVCTPFIYFKEAGGVAKHVAWQRDFAREVCLEEAGLNVLLVPEVDQPRLSYSPQPILTTPGTLTLRCPSPTTPSHV
jgi:hypothetical protein